MLYSDDIDFLFHLHPHGWSSMRVYTREALYDMRISSVFGDPIYDFIQSLIILLKGEKQTSFVWHDEPGGVVWDIQRLPEARQVLSIRIDEFSDFGSHIHDYKNLTNLAQFNILAQHFLIINFYQLKKSAALLQDKNYASNRRDEFPFWKFRELEALMVNVIK